MTKKLDIADSLILTQPLDQRKLGQQLIDRFRISAERAIEPDSRSNQQPDQTDHANRPSTAGGPNSAPKVDGQKFGIGVVGRLSPRANRRQRSFREFAGCSCGGQQVKQVPRGSLASLSSTSAAAASFSSPSRYAISSSGCFGADCVWSEDVMVGYRMPRLSR